MRVNGNFDSNLPSSNLFALEKLESLLLLVLGANVDESIALGATRLAPATTDDTSRVDVDTGRSEEFRESSVVNGEAEVGDEEHGLGGFASRSFTDGADGLGRPGGPDFLGLRLDGNDRVVITGSSCITLLCLCLFGLALEAKSDEKTGRQARKLFFKTHRGALLLGFGSIFGSRGSLARFLGLWSISSAVEGGRCVCCSPDLFGALLEGAPFPPFLFVVKLCNFDDERATVELLLVEEVYGPLSGLGSFEGNEAIACRTLATVDDLGRKTGIHKLRARGHVK